MCLDPGPHTGEEGLVFTIATHRNLGFLCARQLLRVSPGARRQPGVSLGALWLSGVSPGARRLPGSLRVPGGYSGYLQVPSSYPGLSGCPADNPGCLLVPRGYPGKPKFDTPNRTNGLPQNCPVSGLYSLETRPDLSQINVRPPKRPNPKFLTGGKSRLWHKVKVDSGIGLPMVNVLESTMELA
jgi:hypothetical protein